MEQYPSHKVKEFRMDAVVCENKDGAEVTIPCDYIVLAMGARSNEFDAAALEAASIPVYSIGDAAGKAAATIPPASCKTKISFYLWVRNVCGRF